MPSESPQHQHAGDLGAERIAAAEGFPQPCPSTSLGVLITRGDHGALAYDVKPERDPPVWNTAVIRFTDALYTSATTLNDEAQHNHPYGRIAFWNNLHAQILEVENSRFALEWDRRSHREGTGWSNPRRKRHLIFQFKDNSAEIVAERFELLGVFNSMNVALHEMQTIMSR